MTWRYHVTVADQIHRLIADDGETCWGVDGVRGDDGCPGVVGRAQVHLPEGPVELLLVEPLTGGLVLDLIRSYGGLTEAEIRTLVLGVADELAPRNGRDACAQRLSLACFGLDSTGRPRIIPGLCADAPRGTRAAVGEMLYHAAAGRPWSTSLEPVDLAFGEFSPAFRELVATLLTGEDGGSTAADVLDEVVDVLRRGVAPAPLPLLPIERDLDPGASLTARLRMETARRDEAGTLAKVGKDPIRSGDEGVAGAREAAPPSEGRGIASRLRAITGVPTPSTLTTGRKHRYRKDTHGRRIHWTGLFERVERRGLTNALLASGLVTVGITLAALTWTPVETVGGAVPGTPVSDEGTTVSSRVTETDDTDVQSLLERLNERRIQALQGADRAALDALTVPDSSAAAADELLDLEDYAGHRLSIGLSHVSVMARSATAIVVRATMTSGAAQGMETTDGSPSARGHRVEFDLRIVDSEWRVNEVRRVAEG